jgi:hypothetical protein
MNTGTVFEEDGLYKILVKLNDGWPQVKRFSSLEEMLNVLNRSTTLPLEEIFDFCFRGLNSHGKLAELPGCMSDWAAFVSDCVT